MAKIHRLNTQARESYGTEWTTDNERQEVELLSQFSLQFLNMRPYFLVIVLCSQDFFIITKYVMNQRGLDHLLPSLDLRIHLYTFVGHRTNSYHFVWFDLYCLQYLYHRHEFNSLYIRVTLKNCLDLLTHHSPVIVTSSEISAVCHSARHHISDDSNLYWTLNLIWHGWQLKKILQILVAMTSSGLKCIFCLRV